MVLEVILTIAVVAIAIALTLGKGFKITIVHDYKTSEVKPVAAITEEEDEANVRKEIASTLQEIWGLTDEE